MKTLDIVTWPAKVLETPAEDVVDFNVEIQDLARLMHATMDKEGGIGLAANQVNILKRMFTVYIPFGVNRYEEEEDEKVEEQWWHNKRFTFINPVITKKKGRVSFMEGCLSFPEVFDFVERSSELSVMAYDEFGKEFHVEADGLFAICLQHEIDHINGIVFIKRMSRLKAGAIKKKILAEKEGKS
ncbi:MAG: peptide deformylase [Deltaproteobacteria bacterium]|nr:peptide deformylase [Deltaproteobacteria bacterium]